MRVNAFLTFFSQFFMSDFSGHFEARFLYYTYIYFLDNTFYKKVAHVYAYTRAIILKEKASNHLTGHFFLKKYLFYSAGSSMISRMVSIVVLGTEQAFVKNSSMLSFNKAFGSQA